MNALFIFSSKCGDFIGILFSKVSLTMWQDASFLFFFLGCKMANFCHQNNHGFGWGKVSSQILDNEFLEVAKQIGFLKNFYFLLWPLPKIGSFLFWRVASPPTWQNWKKKQSPDVGNPAIETNKETNSRQITMLTSGNANKKMPNRWARIRDV